MTEGAQVRPAQEVELARNTTPWSVQFFKSSVEKQVIEDIR